MLEILVSIRICQTLFIISTSGFDFVSVCLYCGPVGVADPLGLLHMALCPRNMLL